MEALNGFARDFPTLPTINHSSGEQTISTSAMNAEAKSSHTSIAETDGSMNPRFDRRHDLDALRAIAMLLGIVLHVALSFAPIPWTVKDSQQSDIYYLLFAGIHGFRMPLFFMLSGFFTAMLWRKRGLASLVNQRFKRIFLPLVIGCLTIVPAMWVVSSITSGPSSSKVESSLLFQAVVSGDIEQVRRELQNSERGINTRDPNSGATPLCTAVFIGRTEIAQLLVNADADVNLPNRSLSTPLHIAAFMGRAKEAELLIRAGADVNVRDERNLTPADILKTDFGTTNFIASSFGVPVAEDALLIGRKEIAALLHTNEYLGSEAMTSQSLDLEGLKGLLFQLPIFMHLWFLAFLCWLVVAFLIYAPIAKMLGTEKLPRWLICSPISLLWLIPLTMLPQSFMATGSFGPDSSIGLLPIPHVLFYYAIYFFFGAIYWDMGDTTGQLGRRWYVSLPIALLIVFPIALDLTSGTFGLIPKLEDAWTNAMLCNFLQATFAWLMTFGSIGLARRLMSNENSTIRYISDSSYWLYLAHLPLVLLAQWLVKDAEYPAFLKFLGITIATTAFLLFTYEYGVRYTVIGKLLNGPRTRTARR